MSQYQDKFENQAFKGGIGLVVSGCICQRHIGIAFNSHSLHPKLIHLAFHQRLCLDDLTHHAYVIPCTGLNEIDTQIIGAWLDIVWDKNKNNIPYGIDFGDFPYFDKDGVYKDHSPGIGLTCATFVISIFHMLGFQILDLDSWQSRDTDKEWQAHIISCLEDFCARHGIECREHIEKLQEKTGISFRFRPEEVAAGGALYEGKALPFIDAEKAGAYLVGLMCSKGKLPCQH